jgi:hypothetical protein
LLGLLLLYLLLWVPLIPRSTATPQYLAAFINDEPPITYQLVGMGVKPYGNPANFMKDPRRAPAYWGYLGFGNYIYYGGAYLGAAYLLYVPLHKWLGLPDFPTAPICLRCVSVLAGLGALALVYLLAKKLGGRLAALGAGLFFLTDTIFAYYTSIIHPDTTMLFCGLLALWAGIRHAETGRLASLVGLGGAAGLVHGAKMGGPWTIPMAFLALAWGLASSGGWSWRQLRGWGRLFGRVVLLGLAAAAGFFLSTPYALLDSYYFKMVRESASTFTTSPWSEANPIRWLQALWQYLGTPLAVLALAALAAIVVRWLRGTRPRGLTLTAVLGLSVVVWYSTFIRLWVCVPYLMTALAVLSVLLAVLFAGGISMVRQWGRWGRWTGAALVAACLLWIVYERGPGILSYALTEQQRERCMGVVAGHWAESHLSHESKILFDDIMYFDPAVFPKARLLGALMTYEVLETQRPDYFLLSKSVYGADHYVELRRTQKYARGREGPFSVLLYQDLLDRGGNPDIELVKVFRPEPPERSTTVGTLYDLARGALGLEKFTYGWEVRLYRYRAATADDRK